MLLERSDVRAGAFVPYSCRVVIRIYCFCTRPSVRDRTRDRKGNTREEKGRDEKRDDGREKMVERRGNEEEANRVRRANVKKQTVKGSRRRWRFDLK